MFLSLYGARRAFAAAGAMVMMLVAAGQQVPSGQPEQPQSQNAPAGQAQPAPLPPPAVFQNTIPADQLSFLNDYAGQPPKELLKDKRWKALMKVTVPNTTYHYGRDMSIRDAMDMVMDGSKVPVSVRDGRYAMVAGASGPYLRGRGFYWLDMQAGTMLGAFYFQPTNGEPTPTLTVFSRQLTDTELSMGQLPPAFSGQLGEWMQIEHTPLITARYFIPENGKKYVLLHDEEYCADPPGQAGPPANICEQLLDQAADADMNAAYFMKETHNAANATAWMLGPDQVEWVRFRTATCGVTVACRIRVTRERTRVLMRR
jgi:uncharacterized protein YecT (DUF1311 family)